MIISENMQKRAVFYVYVIFLEQPGQADVENGAMLTTYLFRYTSECTISWSDFRNFLRLRRQGGIDRPNQNPADVPVCSAFISGCRKAYCLCKMSETLVFKVRVRASRRYAEYSRLTDALTGHTHTHSTLCVLAW